MAELKAEGASRASFDLEERDGVVRLTVIHEIDRKDSKLIEGVSTGWPKILASFKTLLETGKPLPGTSEWPKGV